VTYPLIRVYNLSQGKCDGDDWNDTSKSHARHRTSLVTQFLNKSATTSARATAEAVHLKAVFCICHAHCDEDHDRLLEQRHTDVALSATRLRTHPAKGHGLGNEETAANFLQTEQGENIIDEVESRLVVDPWAPANGLTMQERPSPQPAATPLARPS
jgi:hypothetical protein